MRKMAGTGLPNVYLIGGYDIDADGAVAYCDLDGLYIALAGAIAARVTPLTAAELRFLRKRMKMTQDDIGRLGGKSDQIAAKWEKGTAPVPVAEGNMLRLLWLALHAKRSLGRAVLAQAQGDANAVPCAYVMRYAEEAGWREDIATAQAMAQKEAHDQMAQAVAQAMSGGSTEVHSTVEAIIDGDMLVAANASRFTSQQGLFT